MHGSDAAAVARAREGDEHAFQLLVEQHGGSVFRLAYRLTGNRQDAEDVVQETFLRAYRELPRFESRANFGTWLYRIASNCSIDFMRSRARHEDRRAQADPRLPGSADPVDGPDVAALDPPADRLVFSAEIQRQVASALEWLTPLERAAFVLRHFDERSIEEIGGILGLRTNATKHSIFRAVKKVRQALGPMVNR